jgi:hypothetical protein
MLRLSERSVVSVVSDKRVLPLSEQHKNKHSKRRRHC